MGNKKLKYLVMDVDGTLTDGKIYMGDSGEVCKAFHVKDGFGIHDILLPLNIEPIIITGRKSKILETRCKEIGVRQLYQGVSDKLKMLNEIINNSGYEYADVAYIGDDLNDLSCMRHVKKNGGVVGCPSDAAYQVREVADFISSYKGGEGAVRDFIEWLFESRYCETEK